MTQEWLCLTCGRSFGADYSACLRHQWNGCTEKRALPRRASGLLAQIEVEILREHVEAAKN